MKEKFCLPFPRTKGNPGVAALVAQVFQVPFSGAGTNTLVWIGPGRAMQIVITTGAVGTIDMTDALTAGFGTAIGTTTVTSAAVDTFLLNGGLGIEIFSGILLTVVGANTGYIVVQEEF